VAAERPLVVLLLPRPLEEFILREQAEDLLREPGVVAIGPGRLPGRVLSRGPVAVTRARQLRRALGGLPRVVVIFHPLQLPVAEALLGRDGGELWYGRWDRYEAALDAGPALRSRITALHERAARRSALTFAASDALAALGPGAPITVGLSAGSFPAPSPSGSVIAVSLGHLGRRVDWHLLREVAEGMPELTVLLVGEDHPDELEGDADYTWCRSAPGLVWLGRRSDEEAARLIGCADVGIVPFRVEPFNDAGLPYRILKVARQGRRSVTPELTGVRTWERAVIRAPDAPGWIAALRSQAGVRAAPDEALREWALGETAEKVNAPLRERLRALGLA
jgi:hypothetical protein